MQKNFTVYGLPMNIPKSGWPAQMADVIWKVMKVSMLQVTLSMIFTGLVIANDNYAQKVLDREVYLNVKEVKLKKVLREIEAATKVKFVYSRSHLKLDEEISMEASGKKLGEVLEELLAAREIQYRVQENDYIVLTRENEAMASIKENSDIVSDEWVAITVTGKITDTKGTTIPGVSILLKGTNTGTVADADGNYSVNVPDADAILVFSSIGYVTQEIPLNGRTTIDVTLVEDVKSLDEVVVVGYGSQMKREVTGAITTISGKQLKQSPATNLSNSLAGRLPGLIATQRGGEPGNDESGLLIRGLSTLGNNSPLIVVDGVPGRGLSQINPNDVESISVLKDASAAAYGSRSANGVILITTKRGSTDKTNISYSGNFGWQIPTRLPEYVNSYDYARLYNEATKNDNPSATPNYTDEAIQKYKDGSDPDRYPNVNWRKEALRPSAPQTQHTLTVTGAGKATRFYTSGSYFGQDGIYHGNAANFRRYSLVSNVDADINKNLKASVDIQGRQENRNSPGVGVSGIFFHVLKTPATVPARYSNGLLTGGIYNLGENPLIESSNQSGFTDNKNQVIQTKFTLRHLLPFITSGLAMEGTFAYDKSYRHVKNWTLPYKYHVLNASGEFEERQFGGKPALREYYEDGRNSYGRFSIDYTRTFGKHNVSALALYEFEDYFYSRLEAYRRDYPVTLPFINLGANNNERSNSGHSYEFARKSYFGRLNYVYDNRYLFELGLRADASANFPESSRWGYFPSVLAGWIISDESWFQVNFVDNLKLRGSWSIRGNDRIPNFQYLSIYGLNSRGYVLNDQAVATLYPSVAANPNVTWEKAESYNIGLDAALLSNKLEFSFDYFKKNTKDILAKRNASIPLYTGISLPDENIGKANAVGFETEATYRNSSIGKLNFFVRGNFAHAKSKIIFIDEPENVLDYQRRTGHPIGAGRWLIADGLFQSQSEIDKSPTQFGVLQPGDIKYKDMNNDGKIDGLDYVTTDKTQNPLTTYGFSLGGDFKGFDFAVLFQGTLSSNLYLDAQAAWPFFFDANMLQKWVGNYWTPENPNAIYPRLWSGPGNNTQPSTFWLNNANYLRLKNVELGYTLPQSIIKKVSISSARIFANALNLFTIAKNKDFDPEYPNGSGWVYPQQKVINVGINVQF